MNRFVQAFAILLLVQLMQAGNAVSAQTKTQTTPSSTQIVFLGTGMPVPDPKRQGPSFVIQTGGNTYLVDIGVGVMRQAAAAGVNISPPTAAFVSHLHTDHTMGLPDLMFTGFANGDPSSFPLYGPVGLSWMVDNIRKAYTQDICVRNNCQFFGSKSYVPPQVHEIYLNYPTGGPSVPPTNNEPPKCTACQSCPQGNNCVCGPDLPKSNPEQVYSDSAITASAFLVRHGCWDEALGYVFQTADNKKIVYSGDTRYVANMGLACSGCDVLIHELYWQPATISCGNYMGCFHTTVAGLMKVWNEGKPKKLVVVHQVGTPGTLTIPTCSSTVTTQCVIFANDLQIVKP